MPDHHQIVDQVRALAQATNQSRAAGLDGWAAAYAQACAEVNERLVRCQRLLQQGLRSEAIQLAEIEPRLLDSVAVLDFPERPAWDELAGCIRAARGGQAPRRGGGVPERGLRPGRPAPGPAAQPSPPGA